MRRVADLPWLGVATQVEVHAGRFKCDQAACPQRIFCERLPTVVVAYGRQTVRLQERVRRLGFAACGLLNCGRCLVTTSVY